MKMKKSNFVCGIRFHS